MPSTARRVALAALALVAAALAGPTARADEKELILSVEPFFALATTSDQTSPGGGAALDVSYGITDALAIRATGAIAGHSLGKTMDFPAAGTLLAYHAGAGLTYTIDILRLVPYADFSIGLLGTSRPDGKGGQKTDNELGIELGIGVDYLVNRRFAVGVVVRYHAFLTALNDLPSWLYVGPRVAIHFGG